MLELNYVISEIKIHHEGLIAKNVKELEHISIKCIQFEEKREKKRGRREPQRFGDNIIKVKHLAL